MNAPTYADIAAAAAVVHAYIKPTPLYEWPALSRLLGCRYFLKHENHTPTTAFKVRGGDLSRQPAFRGTQTPRHHRLHDGQSRPISCLRLPIVYGTLCVGRAGEQQSGQDRRHARLWGPS